MSISINDLKKHLGPGLGLRKNKYMLELPIPLLNGETLNVLCQSAGLPERNMNTTELWHKGRKYHVRGETDYGGEYEISIVDDSKMVLRQIFDNWIRLADDSNPNRNQILSAVSYEITTPNPLGTAGRGSQYQFDINIWQLDKAGDKLYGYKLQNAFPKSIGIVTLGDGEENTLSEFSVTLGYSEFLPIVGEGMFS